MARAAAFAFASLAPASISASYSSSISIRFLRGGPLDAPFYNRTCTAASTHKSLNNRDLQGGPARSFTFGDRFDREIAVNETKPRAAPDGRPGTHLRQTVLFQAGKEHRAQVVAIDRRSARLCFHRRRDSSAGNLGCDGCLMK